jgi:hypothetical protein
MRGGANRHGMRGWPRKKGEGTTPVSAFCSRNAHDRNVLVRRPQSGLTRVLFQTRANEQAWREQLYRSMRAGKDSLPAPPQAKVGEIGRPLLGNWHVPGNRLRSNRRVGW